MIRLFIAVLFALSLLLGAAGDKAVIPVTSADLDTPHITGQITYTLFDPDTALPATMDFAAFANKSRAITITQIWCRTDANTATLNWQRDDGTPVDILSADLVCDVGEQDSCASGCDVNTIQGAEDNIAIGDIIEHVTVSLGVVNEIAIVIKYTVD